jgi:hypothetical protein
MKKYDCQNDVKKCHNVIYYSITADQIIQRILSYYEKSMEMKQSNELT